MTLVQWAVQNYYNKICKDCSHSNGIPGECNYYCGINVEGKPTGFYPKASFKESDKNGK